MLTPLPAATYTPRKSSRRDPWTEDEAREALAAARRSGLSLAAFARRHGLSAPQLYWWHMRIHTHADVERGRPLAFVPVVPVREAAAAAAAANLATGSIELAVGGAVIRLQPGFCEQTLARAVAVLRGQPC